MLLLWLVNLKGEILLRNIAEADDDHRCKYLRDGGIDMKLLHKQLDEDDIQGDTDDYKHEIPE